VQQAHHIEVQLLGDVTGRVVHLCVVEQCVRVAIARLWTRALPISWDRLVEWQFFSLPVLLPALDGCLAPAISNIRPRKLVRRYDHPSACRDDWQVSAASKDSIEPCNSACQT
jgi:hypothetical protein